MTVLIVDDQVSVISGIITGVDWDALGITDIKTACNAAKAKEILTRQPVDILLCDIEMPVENGLSLLRWVRARKIDLTCIFLTAHADFMYAKEAITLGSFDYVLQPARYDDIQAVISRALKRVQETQETRAYENYGRLAYQQRGSLCRQILADWLAGNDVGTAQAIEALAQLDRPLRQEDSVFLVLAQILRWRRQPLSAGQWNDALEHALAAVVESIGAWMAPCGLDNTTMAILFESKTGPKAPPPAMLLGELHRISQMASGEMGFEVAFYATGTFEAEDLSAHAQRLQVMKKNNVIRKPGVFLPDRQYVPQWPDGRAEEASLSLGVVTHCEHFRLKQWEKMLVDGEPGLVADECASYLESLRQQGRLNRPTLQSFYQDFQQVILSAAQALQIPAHDMFGEPALSAMSEKAADSVDDMRDYITGIVARFSRGDSTAPYTQDIVSQIEKHINNNLDKSLYVGEVAESLYLSAGYISRVFKHERGVSLKEYIVTRKMEAAQVLLKTTKLPVSVIAFRVGYDNFSHFSQVYRRVIGLSPTEERKETWGPDGPQPEPHGSSQKLQQPNAPRPFGLAGTSGEAN